MESIRNMCNSLKRMKLFHMSAPSCENETNGILMGCCKNIAEPEHSILCLHFSKQSPQRMKAAARFCATQMPTGKEVLQRRITQMACVMMGVSKETSDDDFEVQWVAFTIIQRSRAAALPDYV